MPFDNFQIQLSILDPFSNFSDSFPFIWFLVIILLDTAPDPFFSLTCF